MFCTFIQHLQMSFVNQAKKLRATFAPRVGGGNSRQPVALREFNEDESDANCMPICSKTTCRLKWALVG